MQARLRIACLSASIGILLVLIELAAPIAATPPHPHFGSNIRVNTDPSPYADQEEPSMVIDPQGRLVVGWNERKPLDQNTNLQPVGVSHSVDGGRSWSSSVFMDFISSSQKRYQGDPWLAVDGRGRVAFARLEWTNDLNPQGVVLSDSADGGATWSATSPAVWESAHFTDKDVLGSDGAGNLYSAYFDLDVSSGNPTSGGVDLVRSSDDGTTWMAPMRVSDPYLAADAPSGIVARPDGQVYLVWWDRSAGNVVVDRSFDFGATWHTDVRVNPAPGTALEDPTDTFKRPSPSLAMDSHGTLFVAWAQGKGRNLDILTSRSTDHGAIWSRPARVNDDKSSGEQWEPSLAVGPDDIVHLAWLDNRTGNYGVYHASSSDGRKWSANERVTDAETSSTIARLGDYLSLVLGPDGTVYVTWTDGRNGNADIYFASEPAASLNLALASSVSGVTVASPRFD